MVPSGGALCSVSCNASLCQIKTLNEDDLGYLADDSTDWGHGAAPGNIVLTCLFEWPAALSHICKSAVSNT